MEVQDMGLDGILNALSLSLESALDTGFGGTRGMREDMDKLSIQIQTYASCFACDRSDNACYDPHALLEALLRKWQHSEEANLGMLALLQHLFMVSERSSLPFVSVLNDLAAHLQVTLDSERRPSGALFGDSFSSDFDDGLDTDSDLDFDQALSAHEASL